MTIEFAKAELWKLNSNSKDPADRFKVQFNPESLKVTFSNQMQPPSQQASDNKSGTAATQYVGHGATKLNVTLWFDVTAPLPDGLARSDQERQDVRRLTQKIINLIGTDPVTVQKDHPIPPQVSFVWGSFRFDGLIESIDQSLEFFSPQGVPLRASLALSMTQQSIDYQYGDGQSGAGGPPNAAALPSGAAPGTSPLTAAPAGSTLQGLAASAGVAANWRAIAEANGIENPRLLAPGQLIDMNVSVDLRAQLGGGLA